MFSFLFSLVIGALAGFVASRIMNLSLIHI